MIAYIVSFILGAFLGAGLMCCIIVGKDDK